MNELLKNNNIKITKQRIIVLKLINKLDTMATLKNIVTYVSKEMDQSTVYRIIEMLVSKNVLEKRINYDDEIYFAIKEEHGHYFTCIKCYKKEKIEDCPILEIEKNFTNRGYEILSHTVLVSGVCSKCRNK